MILVINTQDKNLIEVFLKQDNKIIDSLSEVNERGSEVLLNVISKLLGKHGLQLTDLSSIEVAAGPGSFTGLRVGVSVAQALGFALNIPVNGQVNKPIKLKYTD